MRKVVLTGLGVNCAVGRNFAEFRDALHNGKPGISPLEWIPVSRQNDIAAQLKNIPLSVPGRLRRIARQAIREALCDAGVTPDQATRAGLYLATVAGDALTAERLYKTIASTLSATKPVRAALITFSSGSLADRLARDFSLGGPRDVNTNACASGNIALGRAMQAIRTGQIDLAIVCGADQMKPITYYGADRSNILGSTIRPFHRDRNGTALGDGAGALVIEALDHARARNARIHAVIDGFGISCSEDPHEIIPQLDGRGVARCIRAALADAGISPEQVEYINAHATGTVNIEISECAGIRGAFGALADDIPVNATKSFTAHLSSASAIVEIIASVDALETGFLHETIGLDAPDPALRLNYVPPGGLRRKITTAVSTSMGAGGVNTAVVLSTTETLARDVMPQTAVLEPFGPVWLSATSVMSQAVPRLMGDGDQIINASPAIDWTPLTELERLSGGPANAHYNRAARLALATVTRLVDITDLREPELRSERLALIVGTMLGGTSTWSEVLARTYAVNPRHITPSMALSHGAHLGATLISRRFGLIGLTVTLTGGITAGLSALRYASDLLQLGQIDRAIVCAMDIADEPTRRAIALIHGPHHGEHHASIELHDASVALLLETDEARLKRGGTKGAAITAVEERFAPIGVGQLAPDLAEDALAAALAAAAISGPVMRIDGTANFHQRMSRGTAARFDEAGSDYAIAKTNLVSDFGSCGSAEPLAAVAAGMMHVIAPGLDTGTDIAVTALGFGGGAACAVLSADPVLARDKLHG